MTAEINQVENVLLEAAAAKSLGPAARKALADREVTADRPVHLAHIGSGGFTRRAAIELIEEIRWARKALAVSLESSLLQRLVRRIRSGATQLP